MSVIRWGLNRAWIGCCTFFREQYFPSCIRAIISSPMFLLSYMSFCPHLNNLLYSTCYIECREEYGCQHRGTAEYADKLGRLHNSYCRLWRENKSQWARVVRRTVRRLCAVRAILRREKLPDHFHFVVMPLVFWQVWLPYDAKFPSLQWHQKVVVIQCCHHFHSQSEEHPYGLLYHRK